MTIRCPFCGEAVELGSPADCQRVRCAACSTEFNPHAPGVVVARPAPEAVYASPIMSDPSRAVQTRTVSIDDVERAAARGESLSLQGIPLYAQIARQTRRWRRLSWQARILRGIVNARRRIDHSIGRGGALAIAPTLGAGIFTMLAYYVSNSAVGYVLMAPLGAMLAWMMVIPLSVYPSDREMNLRIADLQPELTEVTARRERLLAQGRAYRQTLNAAEDEYRRLKAVLDSRLNWLRTCQWRVMTGSHFEHFLREVFEERGYAVQATGRTGDQGVDLILERRGERVAVQAKGYTAGNVGNSAVQEAHAGMTYHGCHRAVVVTNAGFTSAARALAERVDCLLVDGDQIEELIEGRLVI